MAAEDREQAMQDLKKRLEGVKNLYIGDPMDMKVLEKYLVYTDGDVDQAFDKLKLHSKLKAKYKEYFTAKRDPNLHDKILKKGIFQILDNRDQLGRRIFLVKIKNMVYGEFEAHEMIQMPDLFLILAMDEEETWQNGIVFILDLEGMSWSLLRYFSVRAVRVASAKVENVPLRHMEIHVLNAGFVVNTAVSMVYPLLSQRIKDMIHFHSDYESLYEYVNPSALPEEYGGEMPPVDSERLIREFLDARNDRLSEILSYGYTSYSDSEGEEDEEQEEGEEAEEDTE